MKNQKQQNFWKAPARSHGGASAAGKRKTARPIATKKPMLLTLKSSRARGSWSFHRFEREIDGRMNTLARKFRVRIYRSVNVGNHLHLVVRAASRREFQNFLRVLTQAIAFLVTGARKGNAVGKFWDALACSRIVEWGKDWENVKRYLEKNRIEAAGVPRELVDEWFRNAPKPV
jgi:hypothetical protein